MKVMYDFTFHKSYVHLKAGRDQVDLHEHSICKETMIYVETLHVWLLLNALE